MGHFKAVISFHKQIINKWSHVILGVFKGIVHPRRLSSFSNPHVVPDMHELFLLQNIRDILKNVDNQTIAESHRPTTPLPPPS